MTDLQFDQFGTLSNGETVTRAVLTASDGISISVISFGGIISAVRTPDRAGRFDNVVLGFADLAAYEAHNGNCHFGALIGRFANRIARGRFSLDGQTYQVPINDGPNSLHGGPNGFGRRNWRMEPGAAKAGASSVILSLVSPHGDAGFPGTLHAEVTYTLGEDATLRIDYAATTDAPTIINLTNHSYFNLAGNGAGSVERHVVSIAADHFTPVDASMIPTGAIEPVAGTPLDFRTPVPIGDRLRDPHPQMALAHGYDHNWVLRAAAAGGLAEAATIHDPESGRALACLTTHPGLQFYTGNFLDGSKCGSAGGLYRQTDGFTLETQHFPDSPNQPNFPVTVLRPGETYRHSTQFRFFTQALA